MTEEEKTPRSTAKKWLLWVPRVLIALIVSFLVGLISNLVFDELFSMASSDASAFGFVTGAAVFVIFITYRIVPGPSDEDSGTSTIHASLKVLSIQKLVAAVGALALGIAAAFVAGQTIITATTSSEQLTPRTPATTAYESILQQQSELISRARNPDTESGTEALKLALEAASSALKRIEESGRLEFEATANSSTQQIDGAFLFAFFSNLFVRVGTILILLFLFSVVVREYRRVDKRHLELQQILLASKLQTEQFDVEALKQARSILRIDDTPKRTDTNEADTQFSEKFIADVSAPIKELAETVKSLGVKAGS